MIAISFNVTSDINKVLAQAIQHQLDKWKSTFWVARSDRITIHFWPVMSRNCKRICAFTSVSPATWQIPQSIKVPFYRKHLSPHYCCTDNCYTAIIWSTIVSWQPKLRSGGFCWGKVLLQCSVHHSLRQKWVQLDGKVEVVAGKGKVQSHAAGNINKLWHVL